MMPDCNRPACHLPMPVFHRPPLHLSIGQMEVVSGKWRENRANVRIYNLNYTVFGEYPSIKEASKSLNCNEKTIRRALKT